MLGMTGLFPTCEEHPTVDVIAIPPMPRAPSALRVTFTVLSAAWCMHRAPTTLCALSLLFLPCPIIHALLNCPSFMPLVCTPAPIRSIIHALCSVEYRRWKVGE